MSWVPVRDFEWYFPRRFIGGLETWKILGGKVVPPKHTSSLLCFQSFVLGLLHAKLGRWASPSGNAAVFAANGFVLLTVALSHSAELNAGRRRPPPPLLAKFRFFCIRKTLSSGSSCRRTRLLRTGRPPLGDPAVLSREAREANGRGGRGEARDVVSEEEGFPASRARFPRGAPAAPAAAAAAAAAAEEGRRRPRRQFARRPRDRQARPLLHRVMPPFLFLR